jgi:hypothetical protein
MFKPYTFWKEAPTNVQVYPCPACHETISVEAANCRFCHLPIDAKVAQQLLVESQRVTTAIARANTFGLSARIAVFVAAYAVWDMYMYRSFAQMLVVGPAVAVGYGAYWLYQNSFLRTHDADHPKAVRKVKWTMVAWAAVLFVQFVAYLILNGLFT